MYASFLFLNYPSLPIPSYPCSKACMIEGTWTFIEYAEHGILEYKTLTNTTPFSGEVGGYKIQSHNRKSINFVIIPIQANVRTRQVEEEKNPKTGQKNKRANERYGSEHLRKITRNFSRGFVEAFSKVTRILHSTSFVNGFPITSALLFQQIHRRKNEKKVTKLTMNLCGTKTAADSLWVFLVLC